MNAFLRMGRTCASIIIGGGLMAGAMLAGMGNQVSVALPHAVTVGSTTLPAGNYKLTELTMGGKDYFVVRGEKGEVTTLPAVLTSDDASRTEVVFSKDGDTWRFDRLAIAEGGAVYSFANTK
jgi:hypothetical protein